MRMGLLVYALAGVALAVPVLEYAPTPGGPWQVDPDAAVVGLGDGTFCVLTPTADAARQQALQQYVERLREVRADGPKEMPRVR